MGVRVKGDGKKMLVCPIVNKEIEEEECNLVCSEAIKEGKSNQTQVAKRFKRIICWKAICKSCKHHPLKHTDGS